MDRKIGAFDAKTKFPELLRAVRKGHRYTITLRGEPVATLAPLPRAKPSGMAVEAMLSFTKSRRPSALDLKSLIEEGRA